MASEDPRALLRAARKDRRVAHPHASYTSTGNLLCNLCEVPIKSEAAWGAHLHSTGHTLRLVREQDAAAARKAEVPNTNNSSNGNGNGIGSKKRKAGSAVDGEDEEEEDRKRVKSLEGGDVASRQHAAAAPTKPQRDAEEPKPTPAPEPAPEHSAATTAAELDALEADLQALERETRSHAPPATAPANATISAPSQTAEELAAQAREDLSAQRGKRDAELEDSKEEAARALEEEFAEMQTLEERVRKLRERREGLRSGRGGQADGGAGEEGNGEREREGGGVGEEGERNGGEGEGEGSDEDDDEDFDDWNFGAR